MPRLLTRILLVTLFAFPASAQPPAAPTPIPAQSAEQSAPAKSKPPNYRGRINLGPQGEMAFFLKPASDSEATLSVPAQGLEDVPLSNVTLTPERLLFVYVPPNAPEIANAKFDIALKADGTGEGTMRQAGLDMKVVVARMAEGEAFGPRRPQNPAAPFPYDSREVVVENPVDGAKLAGTLTVPKAPAGTRHPAVVLITGSGPQDRDETLLTHKPFLVIADHLSRHGLAVLRLDDRGVGGSNSPTPDPNSLTFAGDIAAAVAFLKTQADIDAANIGLVGHSEGGLIAPIVAAKFKDIAFIVLLAGPGVSGKAVLREQMIAIMRSSGESPEHIERVSAVQGRLLDEVVGGNDEALIKRLIRELAQAQLKRSVDAALDPAEAEQMDAMVDQQTAMMRSNWMRTFMSFDPRETLREVRCPVLALNGALDVQVIASQNLPEVIAALLKGGNQDVTAVVLPGLNHLFQTARTGSPAEYMLIDETFAPVALDLMTRWLRVRAGLDPRPALERPAALPLPEHPESK